MPATSTSQQHLMGMVHAYQKGDLKHPSGKVKSVARHISPGDAKDFASTKTKGLPKHAEVMSPFETLLTEKRADVTSTLMSAERQLRQAESKRRSSLEQHIKALNRHADQMKQHVDKSTQSALDAKAEVAKAQADAASQKAIADQQKAQAQQASQAMNDMANAPIPGGPIPPAAQAPYGAMLSGQEEQQ